MDFYSGTCIIQQTTKRDLQNGFITDLQPENFRDILQQQSIKIEILYMHMNPTYTVQSEQHVMIFLRKQMLDGESS